MEQQTQTDGLFNQQGNEQAPAQPQAQQQLQLLSQGVDTSVFASSPSFEHAQRVALMLSKSQLIPTNYQNNIPNTMIALEMANRIGASPLMVMQNLYVVHGRPSWSSSFIIASINGCGRFGILRFELDGQPETDARTCIAWTIPSGTRMPESVRHLKAAKEAGLDVLESPPVSIKMAKDEGWYAKNGSKWKTMPELMLRYRAATFFGRLYAPEILMGMQTAEEVYDAGNAEVTPQDKEAAALNARNAFNPNA